MCVALTSWWSFWVGTAIMATIYPLFILVACPSDPVGVQRKGERAPPQHSHTVGKSLQHACSALSLFVSQPPASR